MAKKISEYGGKCPVCGGALVVSRFSCDGCGSEVSGRFRQNEFAALSGDDLEFLRAFVRARGSIKDVEEALGVSYPTVRGRLERLVEKLGLAAGKQAEKALAAELSERRADILDRLDRGEITPAEAEKLLADLKA